MTYCPNSDENWETLSPQQAGFDPARLTDAIAFAEAHESPWPRDLEKAGDVPGLSQFERPPWNEALGPFKPRGGTNGILLKGGRIVGRWGDPGRVDMTFSIAKSYLAVLAGIALGDGLIPDPDTGFSGGSIPASANGPRRPNPVMPPSAPAPASYGSTRTTIWSSWHAGSIRKKSPI